MNLSTYTQKQGYQILLSILFILPFVACSTSSQQKAEKGVYQYFQETLHDPKSYESVKFGVLEMLFDSCHTPKCQLYGDSLDIYGKLIKRYDSRERDNPAVAHIISFRNMPMDSLLMYDFNSDFLKNKIRIGRELAYRNWARCLDSIAYLRRTNTPKFLGYKLLHRLRAKNKMNATILMEYRCYLDTNLKVLSCDEIKDSD